MKNPAGLYTALRLLLVLALAVPGQPSQAMAAKSLMGWGKLRWGESKERVQVIEQGAVQPGPSDSAGMAISNPAWGRIEPALVKKEGQDIMDAPFDVFYYFDTSRKGLAAVVLKLAHPERLGSGVMGLSEAILQQLKRELGKARSMQMERGEASESISVDWLLGQTLVRYRSILKPGAGQKLITITYAGLPMDQIQNKKRRSR